MCNGCGHEELLDEWRGHYADKAYAWAAPFILKTCRWIKERGHVTERQRRALANVKERAQNPPRRGKPGGTNGTEND